MRTNTAGFRKGNLLQSTSAYDETPKIELKLVKNNSKISSQNLSAAGCRRSNKIADSKAIQPITRTTFNAVVKCMRVCGTQHTAAKYQSTRSYRI